MNLGTFKLNDNTTKYVGIDEIIYVLKKEDKWVSWHEQNRFHRENLKNNPNYDFYIISKLEKEMANLA